MFKPKLTEDIVYICKLLLAQSNNYDCDCQESCSCLEIVSLEIDIQNIVIKTKNTVYKTYCLPFSAVKVNT